MTTAPTASADSLNDISQLIHDKERELHEYHDLRCAHLENLVEERDELLQESSKRFEKLRDDFSYNLTLIQARDMEIDRLEQELKSTTAALTEKDAENKQYFNQIDMLERREASNAKKAEQDRQHHKRIFEELQEGIEQMRWAAEEELRSKDLEVDQLRADVKRAQLVREEGLGAQRRDLTSTFEGLLKQRADAQQTQEREIAQQVSLLDHRLEQLQTENVRLRQELDSHRRKAEELTEDNVAKEEAKQQAIWKLEDKQRQWRELEDKLTHQIQQLSLTLSVTKDNASRDMSDLKKKVTKAKEEKEREAEFRVSIEQRMEDVKLSAQRDLLGLEQQLADMHASDGRLQQQMRSLREERDAALQKHQGARLEADAVARRLAAVDQESAELQEELVSQRGQLRETADQLAELQQEYQDYRCQTGEKETAALEHVREQLVSCKQAHAEELSQLRQELLSTASQRAQEAEEESHAQHTDRDRRHAQEMEQVQRRVADLQSEAEIAKEALKGRTRELEEEKSEAAALRLRFRLLEAQARGAQEELRQLTLRLQRHEPHYQPSATANAFFAQSLQSSTVGGAAAGAGGVGGVGVGVGEGRGRREINVNAHEEKEEQEQEQGSERGEGAAAAAAAAAAGVESPMFSEDLGPASFSFPNSPQHTPGVVGMNTSSGGVDPSSRDHYYYPFSNTAPTPPMPFNTAHRIGGGGGGGNIPPSAAAMRSRFSLSSSFEGQGHNNNNNNNNNNNDDDDSNNNKVNDLLDENERLKKIVKEMRSDVELLQQTQHTMRRSTDSLPTAAGMAGGSPAIGAHHHHQSPPAYARDNIDGEDAAKCDLLEKRLQQTVEEVNRLRQERGRLMDVGNELRSALNKVQFQHPQPGIGALGQVEMVHEWLTNATTSASTGPTTATTTANAAAGVGAAAGINDTNIIGGGDLTTHISATNNAGRGGKKGKQYHDSMLPPTNSPPRPNDSNNNINVNSTHSGTAGARIWGNGHHRNSNNNNSNNNQQQQQPNRSHSRGGGISTSAIHDHSSSSSSSRWRSGSYPIEEDELLASVYKNSGSGSGSANKGHTTVQRQQEQQQQRRQQQRERGGEIASASPERKQIHESSTVDTSSNSHIFPGEDLLHVQGHQQQQYQAPHQTSGNASAGSAISTGIGTGPPTSNSSRTTPSQLEALKRIQSAQERKRAKLLARAHRGSGNDYDDGSGEGTWNRKVMNYARYREPSADGESWGLREEEGEEEEEEEDDDYR